MRLRPGVIVKDKLQVPRPGQQQDIGRITAVGDDEVVVQWQDHTQRPGELTKQAAQMVLDEVDDPTKYCEICVAESDQLSRCAHCHRRMCPDCEEPVTDDDWIVDGPCCQICS